MRCVRRASSLLSVDDYCSIWLSVTKSMHDTLVHNRIYKNIVESDSHLHTHTKREREIHKGSNALSHLEQIEYYVLFNFIFIIVFSLSTSQPVLHLSISLCHFSVKVCFYSATLLGSIVRLPFHYSFMFSSFSFEETIQL